MLRLRLIYGLSLAALIIGLLLLDAWLTTLNPPHWRLPGIGIDAGVWLFNGVVCTGLICVLVWITAHELVGLARAMGFAPFALLAQLGAVGLALGPYVVFNGRATWGVAAEPWGMGLLVLALALAFLAQARRHRTHAVMVNLATTIFIICYAGGLACFMTRLRMEVGGTTGIAVLLFSAFVVKMTDVGAYCVGRAAGRRQLIAWLSPKKTWEGMLGGLLVAILCAIGVGLWLHVAGWLPLWHRLPAGEILWILAAFGLLMGLLSVAGDLCASLLKRDAAVKDSGNALPGLGGILDVVDSPLLAAPAAWLFWTHL